MKQFTLHSFNLLFTFLYFFTISTSVPAQIQKMWTLENNYYTPGPYNNYFSATDSAGNSYVANIFHDPSSLIDTVSLVKYNEFGSRLWKKTIINDNDDTYYIYLKVHIDGLQNVIINLGVDSSFTTTTKFIKCDTAGIVQWQLSFPDVYAMTPEFDNSGNMFNYYPINSIWHLYKHNAANVLQYDMVIPVPDSFGLGLTGPVIDKIGNAWFPVFKNTPNSESRYYKINPSGIIVDSLVSQNCNFGPLLFDNQNNLFLTVWEFYPNNGLNDTSTTSFRKYDSALNLIWDSGPVCNGVMFDVKLDDFNNLYSFGMDFIGVGVNRLVKVDAGGNLSFSIPFDTTSSGANMYQGSNHYSNLFLDSIGNPVVIGEYNSAGFGFFTNEYPTHIYIRRFNSNGNQLDFNLYSKQDTIFPWLALINTDFENNTLFATINSTFNRFCFDCTPNVTGTVFYDSDQNCTLNGTEHGLPGAIVKVMPLDQNIITDSLGIYRGFLPDGVHNITFNPYLNYTPSCGISNVNIQISNGGPVLNINSGKYLNPAGHDLELYKVRGFARPGFDMSYTIDCRNTGAYDENGNITLVHDSIFSFIQSTPAPDLISGDTLRWNFASILQGLSTNINLILNTDAAAAINTQFTNHLIVTDTSNDLTPINNIILDTGSVRGSFDPNIKIAEPAGFGPQGYISANNDPIQYTIHFENLGNDTAFTVLVIDTLDTDLDPATFTPVTSSHSYTWQLFNSNIIWFRFDNIQLADSSNPADNKGFISYTIRQNSGLTPGTVINNTADIFFDFNQPVRTNTTLHTIAGPAGITEVNKSGQLNIYPNPSDQQITITYGNQSPDYKLQVLDMLGNCIVNEISNGNTVLNINQWQQGMYLVRITDGIKVNSGRFVKL